MASKQTRYGPVVRCALAAKNWNGTTRAIRGAFVSATAVQSADIADTALGTNDSGSPFSSFCIKCARVDVEICIAGRYVRLADKSELAARGRRRREVCWGQPNRSTRTRRRDGCPLVHSAKGCDRRATKRRIGIPGSNRRQELLCICSTSSDQTFCAYS